jgi:hypothetical protein
MSLIPEQKGRAKLGDREHVTDVIFACWFSNLRTAVRWSPQTHHQGT